MMKIHGLSDAAYHLVQYLWFLLMYLIHVTLLIGIGSAANLGIFRSNQYSLQFVRFLQPILCSTMTMRSRLAARETVHALCSYFISYGATFW